MFKVTGAARLHRVACLKTTDKRDFPDLAGDVGRSASNCQDRWVGHPDHL